MSVLVVGVFLYAADTLLIEELHVVTCGAIEEVVSTHTQPEEVNLAVGIGHVVIDATRQGCGSEGAVRAEVRELVEIGQAAGETLIATTGETTDGAMVAIVDGAIVTLHVWHEVFCEVVAKHIAHTHAHHAALWRRWQELSGVAVGQHDDHLLRLALSQEVVEDVVHASHLVIDLLRVGRSADEVEDRIALVGILLLVVCRWQIDDGVVGALEALGIVMDVLHLAMRHFLDVVRQRARLGRNLQEAVLEALVGEILRTERIHHADPIDHKAVGVHVGGSRAECRSPNPVGIFLHGVSACELHIHLHLLGVGVFITEGYRTVGIANGRLLHLLCHCSGRTEASRYKRD